MAGRRGSVDVSLLSSGHDAADARLHRLVAALISSGISVEVYCPGSAGDLPLGVRPRTFVAHGLAARAFQAVRLPWSASGRVLLVIDPDLVPSAALRRFFGVRLVVDLSEDYAKLVADRPWVAGWKGPLVRLLVRLATHFAASADLTVVADEHVPPLRARHRLVLRNLPYGDYLPAPGPPECEPRAIYIGDVRSSRGLFDMLDAMVAAPDWTLDLVGTVAPADADRLSSRLAEPELARRVRLHGRLPIQQAWHLASGAWVGLLLLHETPAFRDALPSKLYEYLRSGLAVVVTPLPRQAELVKASRAGVVVVDGAAAGAALVRLGNDRRQLEEFRSAAVAARQPLDGEIGQTELARAIRSLLKPTP